MNGCVQGCDENGHCEFCPGPGPLDATTEREYRAAVAQQKWESAQAATNFVPHINREANTVNPERITITPEQKEKERFIADAKKAWGWRDKEEERITITPEQSGLPYTIRPIVNRDPGDEACDAFGTEDDCACRDTGTHTPPIPMRWTYLTVTYQFMTPTAARDARNTIQLDAHSRGFNITGSTLETF